MAEQNLVDGLQNLRVVAAYDLAVMDDLARDFANALEDFPMTSRLRSTGNESARRRRFRKRRPKGTLPTCSDSDTDLEKMVTNESSNKRFSDSDSDDMEFFTKQRYSLSRFPAISAPLLVESDSVTDCLPTNHPPRKRKFLKKMNVEDIKVIELEKSMINTTNCLLEGQKCPIQLSDPSPVRKRKRSIRENKVFLESCDVNGGASARLLSPCSCKSDAENSSADERDADDEQSDFYFESDQSYPGPPSKHPATSPQTTSTTTHAKKSPSSKETKIRKNKNHVFKHFLQEQLTITMDGRLFIPAKRRLVATSNPQKSDPTDSTMDQSSSHHQDMDTNATPLSSPPLNCHKRHKLWHDNNAPSNQTSNYSLSGGRNKKKKLFNFISGWLTTSSTC